MDLLGDFQLESTDVVKKDKKLKDGFEKYENILGMLPLNIKYCFGYLLAKLLRCLIKYSTVLLHCLD